MSAPLIAGLTYKAITAAVGSVLTLLGPWILEQSVHLPQPWPLLVGGIFGLATILGVYHAPYVPKDAVLVPAPPNTSTTGTPWPAG